MYLTQKATTWAEQIIEHVRCIFHIRKKGFQIQALFDFNEGGIGFSRKENLLFSNRNEQMECKLKNVWW